MPTDVYGLVLSTTPEAAAAYNEALACILCVRSGAEEQLRKAISLDPGFALGYAALALLGHEFGASVDVPAALQQAAAAAREPCSDRERSFVHVVSRRVAGPADAGCQAILRHISEFPRDALTVSAAVPTIAFAGVTELPQDGWDLVERLAASYGDDWWYAGLLAFTRTDQERWEEAAELAQQALDREPCSGHAVHAMAHVHYETADHTSGLQWLDQWICASGNRMQHQSHFSWHAALHELALGDDVALRRRYFEQLAPPRVSGLRVLVDSASLLWRAGLEDAWQGPPPIGPVLEHAGVELLTEPPTAFAAMHAALALATAADASGLARLHTVASGHPRAVFREVVSPVIEGLLAFVEQRYDDAATALLEVEPAVWRLGGSLAQREVVQDTLLHALLGAGRVDEARIVLERRLDRRPSRRDLCRLGRLHAQASDSVAVPPDTVVSARDTGVSAAESLQR